ncbi:MAG: YnfU family zinc-binding protein [Acidobacteriota bacterium]
MKKDQLSITCPLCGRRAEHPVENLREGEDMVCPHCSVKLNLHGHMWQEIAGQLEELQKSDSE